MNDSKLSAIWENAVKNTGSPESAIEHLARQWASMDTTEARLDAIYHSRQIESLDQRSQGLHEKTVALLVQKVKDQLKDAQYNTSIEDLTHAIRAFKTIAVNSDGEGQKEAVSAWNQSMKALYELSPVMAHVEAIKTKGFNDNALSLQAGAYARQIEDERKARDMALHRRKN